MIDTSISAGYSRFAVVLCKALIVLVLMMVLLLPYLLVTLFGLFSDVSFAPYIPTPLLTIMSAQAEDINGLQIAGSLIGIALLYIAQMSLCLLFMFLFKKPVITLACSYIALLLLGPISNMNEVIADIMFNTPFGMERLSTLSPSITSGEFFGNMAVCIAFVVAMIGASYLAFRKAEIK